MTDTFKAFCPNCERITEQVFIECDDHFLVDDQDIIVHLKYYVCLECGEDYEIPSADYDPLAELYQKLGLKTHKDRKAFFATHHITEYNPFAELYLKLGLKTYEDRKAFFDIHRIAFNIRQMKDYEKS